MSASIPSSASRHRRPVLQFAVEYGLAGLGGAGVGALVALVASVLEKERIESPLVLLGVLSGLVTGIIAASFGRELLPRLKGFTLPLRGALMVFSLAGAAFAITALWFWVYPWYVVHSLRSVMLVGAINGILAVVTGALVFVYEDLVRRLAKVREQLAAERLAQAEASERMARAELHALQARINPHFFFNALNTAVAYVREDAEYAEQLLVRFSDLFRYAFRRGRERTVPLEAEFAFVHDYLEIESARFGERFSFEVHYEPELGAEPLPPLILQPLVENAVLHGRDRQTGSGRVKVSAMIEGDARIVLEVRDHGPGPGEAAHEVRRGHALENIKARIEAFREGTLEIVAAPEGRGTRARITLPLSGPTAGRAGNAVVGG